MLGAVANMWSGVFRAVMAGVSFVCVMDTMSDVSILLTTVEWQEWEDSHAEEVKDPYAVCSSVREYFDSGK